MGIGTSVDALIRHGIDTDIVELDPTVYRYARDYFFLSPNHTAYLEDAVGFVKREKAKRKGEYHFVLHDVFTGGAVPAELFTREMLQGLEEMMADDGIVAIVSFHLFPSLTGYDGSRVVTDMGCHSCALLP